MNRKKRNAAKMLERYLMHPTYDPKFDAFNAVRWTCDLRIRYLRALGIRK